MPRPVKVKFRVSEPLQVTMDNDLIKNTSIVDEQAFDTSGSNYRITSITIEGVISGFTSPMVIEVDENNDCTVTVTYEEKE